MKEKIYLNILFLCGIWYQGIIETLAEENIKEFSHLVSRNKRLVSRKPSEIVPKSIDQVPYVVKILENNHYSCVGSILLAEIIITSAHCMEERGTYTIVSGSAHAREGIRHNITEYRIHPQYQPPNVANDLALLRINPGIDIVHSPNRPIIMRHGHVPPRTVAQVSSWGCIRVESNGITILPNELRSIKTVVINQEECDRMHNRRRQEFSITERDICTYDKVNGNRCHNGDSGSPLVIFNQLAGVMAWNRQFGGPDIFMNLSYPIYRDWILDNLPPNELYPARTHRVDRKH